MKRHFFALCLFLVGSALVFAQASAALNGRVVDPQGASIPNAAITITNAASGLSRNTITNAEGLYSVPALLPGDYDVKAAVQGFNTAERQVQLATGASLTVDLQMAVSGVKEAVSVEASAALVETTQSTQGGSILQREVSELPMLNRSMASLIALIPGAREVTVTVTAHGVSSNYVSIGGGAGQNFDTLVDGIEDKEDQCGGTMITYNLDSVQELKTMTTGANAEYGRGTAQVLVATKSGTNQIHGSAFGYFRNQDLVRTDYFSDPAHGGLGKPPFSRKQYGGSLGGKIIKDKLFYFGSVEHTGQTFNNPIAGPIVEQQTILNNALQKIFNNNPNYALNVTSSIPQPLDDWLYTGKINWQPTASHSVYLRYSGETGWIDNDFASASGGSVLYKWQPYDDENRQYLMDAAVGDTWVINSTTVNQFTSQWISFKHDQHYPPCPINVPNLGTDSCISLHLVFPSVNTAIGYGAGFPDWFTRERKWQWRDDLSKQMGRHALKAGIDYMYMPTYGGFFAVYTPGVTQFADDPGTIVNNTNRQYPQGFSTPGAVYYFYEGSAASSAQNVSSYYSKDNWNVGVYGQDDFKITSRLTLNYGLRYDIYSLFNSKANMATNPIYSALKAIGNPFGQIPDLPSKSNIQPRVGIAWDLHGNGKDVVRLSYGVFNVEQIKNTTWLQDENSAPQKGLSYLSLTLTSLQFGAPGNFIYGTTPYPAQPPISTNYLPGLGASAYWYDPKHTKDAQTQQFHLGWSHRLGPNSVISIDETGILLYNGWRQLDINPVINGVRPLNAALTPVIGAGAVSSVYIESAVNHAYYDETTVHFERRLAGGSFQVNYTLAWSHGMGGCADGTIRCGAPYPQQPSATGGNIYAPWESGPTGFDERHRITALGVFNLPYKIEVSPSLTFATSRPYTIFSGPNPDQDGNLLVLNSSGNPVGINSVRGQPLFVMNARVTRNFKFGADGRFNIAAFGELYNITDRANFGNQYGTLQNSPTTFEKPIGYLGGFGAVSSIPNSFQVQFGGRFTF